MGQAVNADGLLVKYGTTLGNAGKAGTYRYDGPLHVLEVKDLSLTTLVDDPTTVVNGTAQGIVDLHNVIPTGALIEKVEIVTNTAATSAGSARLNIGVVDKDFVGNDDEDGLVDLELYDTIGTVGNIVTYTQGSTAHGVLVGTVTTKPLYVTASYDTAVFATGNITVRIYYSF